MRLLLPTSQNQWRPDDSRESSRAHWFEEITVGKITVVDSAGRTRVILAGGFPLGGTPSLFTGKRGIPANGGMGRAHPSARPGRDTYPTVHRTISGHQVAAAQRVAVLGQTRESLARAGEDWIMALTNDESLRDALLAIHGDEAISSRDTLRPRYAAE